jgi:MFS family permease
VPTSVESTRSGASFGRYVLVAAFILAIFGWGTGFYGPPVFLSAVVKRTGWSVQFVSGAVTVHFLCGAIVVACLPSLYRRFGVAIVTSAGVLILTAGLLGWALASSPWQLLLAAILSGAGWVTMGAAALNAIVSPWFLDNRANALSMAYNGASIGGMIMSPLWALLIFKYSFVVASSLVGAVMVPAVMFMSYAIFTKSPVNLAQATNHGTSAISAEDFDQSHIRAASATSLWRNRSFTTLTAAMALGLFAQVGLLAHLFSVMAPRLSNQGAGWALTAVTAASVVGRFVASRVISAGADRRLVACVSYTTQLAGSLVLVVSAGVHLPLLLVGIVLFGIGVGNATSLPPLIAQREFAEADVQRVVARTIAISQGTYAFAPVVFGVLIGGGEDPMISSSKLGITILFIATALIQALAAGSILFGRRRQMQTK